MRRFLVRLMELSAFFLALVGMGLLGILLDGWIERALPWTAP